MNKNHTTPLLWLIALVVISTSCQRNDYVVDGNGFSVQFNQNMHSKVVGDTFIHEPLHHDFSQSETLETNYGILQDFVLKETAVEQINGPFGPSTVHHLTGLFHHDEIKIQKELRITVYDNYPGLFSTQVEYTNQMNHPLRVTGWTNNAYTFNAVDTLAWSFQGATYSSRPDWILPVKPGYYRKNYMGQNSSDYGGGIPVIDLWRKDGGMATGVLETKQVMVSLPVEMKTATSGIRSAVEFNTNENINPGNAITTYETFVYLHTGDCFVPLQTFSALMQKLGIRFPESEEAAFESIWCAWGYERNFTLEEVIGTLPKVKELGIKWAVLDDGFQVTEGDWTLNKQKFPGGDRQMKDFVKTIHDYGLKAKLWYAPLAIDLRSELYQKDPNLLLINEMQSPQFVTWWDCFMMAPQYDGTIRHTMETIEMFMEDWGFDGLKLDGQHLNSVPCDYNYSRPPDYPAQSVEALPHFFDTLYKKARAIKPDAVVEICPCGCCCNYFIMPYMNQAVSSDPTSSWQIRLKGKVYRALMPNTAYYGDHVELSDNASDFETTFGIGAVPGTKFTWPNDNPSASGTFVLTPEKEKIWKFWFNLYDEMRLSQGEYIGDLYDIGFDTPETHVIRKNGNLYYAFYATGWNGEIQFRGLQEGKYQVTDYVNNIELGIVTGPVGSLVTSFEHALLVQLSPINKQQK